MQVESLDGMAVRPFVSIVVASSTQSRTPERLAEAVKKWLKDEKRSAFTPLLTDAPETRRFHYLVQSPPSWLVDGVAEIEDRIWHVVMITRRKRAFAIHCSESQGSAKIEREIKNAAGLDLIAATQIERALARGRAKTLWLRDVRRTSAHRPQRKTLAGEDLGLALDPLEDQGYAFSSARCDFGETVGVSPGRGRIWTRRAENAADFDARAGRLLEAIGATRVRVEPDGFRSRLAPTETARKVRDAFDVNIGAPELDSTADDDEFVLVARELAEQAALTVENAKGSGFDLVVVLSGRDAHRFSAELDDARVAFACAAEHDHDSSCKEILAVLNEPGWTAVRYASGHTVSDSRIYEMRQLPVSFEPNFSVLPSDVDAHEEKPRNAKQPKSDGTRERDSLEPVALANTLATDRLLTNQCSEGREKRSLFNWIVFDRPEDVLPAGGWLLCDDGAGEHADFVHLDSQNCVVRLIHVKAAHSKAASISLGDFEEVVSQAIKNARWLAFDDMSKRLATQPAKHLKDLVWPPPDISFAPGENKRARFADELENLGEDVTRHVVVVQPGLTQSAWDNAVTAKQKIARELLSTLLFSARATCFGLAADFTVVGHADN